MTPPRFTVTRSGDALVAVTDAPELAEVVWTWHGGALVEYGLPGHPVGVVNVYDYEAGAPVIPFTPDALGAELKRIYADLGAVAGVAEEVAQG